MKKKISYTTLLKEALLEDSGQDSAKSSMDVKGPMLDPIIGYDGGGELPTYKDAASILERYYFKENDNRISLDEHTDNVIVEVPGKEDSSVKKTKKDIKKEVANEMKSKVKKVKEEEEAEDEEVLEESDCGCDNKKSNNSIEEAVIAKLIQEMEEEDSDEDAVEDKKEIKENRVSGDRGAGTEAAGTGDDEKLVPKRKDSTNEELSRFLDEANSEMDMMEDEDEELDVDKKVSKEGLEKPSKKVEDEEDALSEAFAIFKEEIEAEEPDEEDSDEIMV